MLGLGETHAEVAACMQDLREAGVDILTLGQYLQVGGGRGAGEGTAGCCWMDGGAGNGRGGEGRGWWRCVMPSMRHCLPGNPRGQLRGGRWEGEWELEMKLWLGGAALCQVQPVLGAGVGHLQ